MLLETIWLPIFIKAAATAIVVISATLVAETLGPFFGALVATLPVAAGPAYIMLAMRANDQFIAQSALGSFTASAATLSFLLVFIRLAPRFSLLVSLGAALFLWFIAAALIRAVDWSTPAAIALDVAAFLVAIPLTRQRDAGARPVRSARQWFDLPLRAISIGLVVAAVVTLSDQIGPAATGMGAVFPVSLTSLALVVYPRLGGAVAAATMTSALRAMVGFTLALLVLHVLVTRQGPALALSAALLTCIGWSAGMIAWKRLIGPRLPTAQTAPDKASAPEDR
jgi:hypothetical protein